MASPTLAAPSVLALGPNTAQSVHVHGVPFSIRCLEGSVWITHPADPGDHVLAPGEVFTASGPGHLVATAFEPCRVVLSCAAAAPARTAARPLPPAGRARRRSAI
jgi:Protein of unknown function (DUF2917)